jgi:hypothetical protein
VKSGTVPWQWLSADITLSGEQVVIAGGCASAIVTMTGSDVAEQPGDTVTIAE